jgi:hypothetical protein
MIWLYHAVYYARYAIDLLRSAPVMLGVVTRSENPRTMLARNLQIAGLKPREAALAFVALSKTWVACLPRHRGKVLFPPDAKGRYDIPRFSAWVSSCKHHPPSKTMGFEIDDHGRVVPANPVPAATDATNASDSAVTPNQPDTGATNEGSTADMNDKSSASVKDV